MAKSPRMCQTTTFGRGQAPLALRAARQPDVIARMAAAARLDRAAIGMLILLVTGTWLRATLSRPSKIRPRAN